MKFPTEANIIEEEKHDTSSSENNFMNIYAEVFAYDAVHPISAD